MKLYACVASTVFALLAAVPAAANTIVYSASLNSAAENNVNDTSPGIGSVTVTVDFDSQEMNVSATFSGMQGQSTASHIHCCANPPTSVGVATMIPSFVGFPLGVFAGNYSQTFDMTQAASYNAAFIAANGGTAASAFAALTVGLNSGQAYFNIHTNLFSAGEIRGQLTPAPLPGSLSLMLAGLAGLATRLRRR
jgi:hypothetical protein